MADQTILRTGTITRILRMDSDLKENFTLSKQTAEFMNQAACVFVRTLTKSCAVSAARSGKKGRLDVSDLETVLKNYPQLAFLTDNLPAEDSD